jgi:hypothetical protein
MREGGEQRALYRNIQHPYTALAVQSVYSAYSVFCLCSGSSDIFGSDQDPGLFISDLQDANKRYKVIKKAQNNRDKVFFLLLCLMMEGSGSETLIFVDVSDPHSFSFQSIK